MIAAKVSNEAPRHQHCSPDERTCMKATPHISHALRDKLARLTKGTSRDDRAHRLTHQDIADAMEAGLLRQDRHGALLLTGRATKLLSQDSAAEPAALPAAPPVRKKQEAPLAWLAKRSGRDGRPWISPHQHEAGRRLALDFQMAGMTARVTMSWTSDGTARQSRRAPGERGLEPGERAAAAADRVRAALSAVGPELSGILLDVCCFEIGLDASEKAAGWPSRSGKVVLQIALERLARHYGIQPAPPKRQRITHWGAAGYRPAIAREPSSE